nr:MAG TPA: hypothetical protein [Bacteriophage sp.]
MGVVGSFSSSPPLVSPQPPHGDTCGGFLFNHPTVRISCQP